VTAPTPTRVPRPVEPERRRAPARRRAIRRWPGLIFVTPYLILTAVFGIGPAIYAIKLSLTKAGGGFAALGNYKRVIHDFRFMPDVEHVAQYIAIWVVSMIVFVVTLALMVHRLRRRWMSGGVRLLYYVPGALAGASSVLLWLFMLDPGASPVGSLLRALGYSSFAQTIAPTHLPVILAIIAFWAGAGGWIVVMYGALNNVSLDIMEAARIDGANAFQTAMHIQLPLLRKWIAYMAVLSIAAGTQLFVEPTLLSQASNAIVPNDYSLNQLAFQYAFDLNDLNGSAAISVMLLLVALIVSAVFVSRGRLFDTDVGS
jgi:multiple sugar transport system permease protein